MTVGVSVTLNVVVQPRDALRVVNAYEQALLPQNIVGQFFALHLMPYLRSKAVDRFATEGDPASGGKWAPLKPMTEEIRARQAALFGLPIGPAHPINQRTGGLYKYITKGRWESVMAPGFTRLTWPGSPPTSAGLAQKVKTAQLGRTKPRTPARPVVGLDSADLVWVTSVLATWIHNEAAQRVGPLSAVGI